MNLQTARRLQEALETPEGRRHYKVALRTRFWRWLGRLPWEMNYKVKLGGQMPMILSTADQVISQAIFATGEWEPEELAVLRRFIKPGMVTIDVGANIGVHSLTMAQLVGPEGAVHSFEPTNVFARLKKNVELNGFTPRIHLNHCAVGPVKGSVRLMKTKPGFELFTSRSTPLDPSVGLNEFVDYPMVSLDDYCAERNIRQVDFLKIDVEGGEPGVLAGAKKLMESGAIRCLLFEFNYPCLMSSGESPGDLLASVASSGFQVRFLDRDGRYYDHVDSIEGLALNILAVPLENAAQLPPVLVPASRKRNE